MNSFGASNPLLKSLAALKHVYIRENTEEEKKK